MTKEPGGADTSPGQFVIHAERQDWGLGQVQSAIGHKVTVNFEHAGKVVLDTRHVRLLAAKPGRPV